MKRKLIVVDTETAGLDPSEHSILSFAAVIYQDGGISGSFAVDVCELELCVQEPHDIGGGKMGTALDVNGFTIERIKAGASPWMAVKAFQNWLMQNELYGKQVLVGHKAEFDAGFLRRLWTMAGEDFEAQFGHRYLCTQSAALLLEQAGRIELSGGSSSLDNVAAAFGLSRTAEKHDALEDATLTAKVLAKMVSKIR